MPGWTETLSALLTPTIAIGGLGIAFLQWRTAEKKRQQDLFDKRFAIFDCARTLLHKITIQEPPTKEDLKSFYAGTAGAEFLFNGEIGLYIKTIGDKAHDFSFKNAMADRIDDGERRDRTLDAADEINDWLMTQLSILERKTRPFLEIS